MTPTKKKTEQNGKFQSWWARENTGVAQAGKQAQVRVYCHSSISEADSYWIFERNTDINIQKFNLLASFYICFLQGSLVSVG